MNIVGLITEYNPFHNGHLYHIQEAKRVTGADAAVVIMSGNFVQRGAPAMFDKYTRAHAALLSGADLVLELPVSIATGSAEAFARGGVRLIQVLSLICALEASVEICLLLSGWLHFSLRNQQTISCICKMA